MNIKVENLVKNYFINGGTEVKILKGIDLEIKTGDITAVVGPSGAGKSTLLHILGLMDKPSSGKIFFDELDYSSLNDTEYAKIRKNKIGFMFQLHYLLPDFTVWENVIIPVWDKKDKKEIEAKQLLDKLGLYNRINHMPSELSGGEQQRVAFARALINNPELLMADEPTGNLDESTAKIVESIIFTECKQRNITLLLVTHNPDLAAKADRIIKLHDGKINNIY